MIRIKKLLATLMCFVGIMSRSTKNTSSSGSLRAVGILNGFFVALLLGFATAPLAEAQVLNGNSDWPRDTDTEVVDVTNPATGQTWMDRNLGASRVATSIDDEQAYGDLYQWGRAADGHQKRNSGTTTTLSVSDQPGDGEFILTSSSSRDWRSPQNDNLWQEVNRINNPCPDGYRLPTEAEWEAERQSWSSNNRNGTFKSPLKLPVAGYRNYYSDSFGGVGSLGAYWSDSVSDVRSLYLSFNSNNAIVHSRFRAFGFSVRCIKD